MTDSQTPAMDIQAALAALMANMQTMREENKAMREENKANIQSVKEDASKQNKALREKIKKSITPYTTRPNRTSNCWKPRKNGLARRWR